MGRPTLVLDACGARCAAAVVRDGAVIAERAEPMERGHAERLMPLALAALVAAGCAPSDLGLVAVATGPGGFAGPRIGVAAARGLALGLGIRAVGVSRLEAVAAGEAGRLRVAAALPDGRFLAQDFADGAAVSEPVAVETADGARLAPEAADPLSVARAALARDAVARGAAPRPAPLYARPPDATPPDAKPAAPPRPLAR